jgi:hypothetical protein
VRFASFPTTPSRAQITDLGQSLFLSGRSSPEHSLVDRVRAVGSRTNANGTRSRPSKRLFPISRFPPRLLIKSPPRSDKYVTRAEYDQLKARVEQLERILNGITGAGNVHMQPTMVGAPTIQTGAVPSNPPYAHHHSRSTSGSYSLGPEYASDPYSVNARHSVTAMPSSSRTTLSGDINPPPTEREISTSRQYPSPHRPASRQFRSALGPVPAAPPYGSTEGIEERPKKRSAWTLQGVRPRRSCRAVDLVRQPQLYSTLLPCLCLLACILRILTRPLLPLVRPRSSRWKSLPKARPSADPIPQGDYGTTGRTVTQSPLWSSPQSGPVTAASSCNPPSLPVTNDPCRTPENSPACFLGLGCANRAGVLG